MKGVSERRGRPTYRRVLDGYLVRGDGARVIAGGSVTSESKRFQGRR
jgi:hypothetical protein